MRPISPRRCRSTRCADRFIRSRRAFTRRGRFRTADVGRQYRGPDARQRHQPFARALRQGPGRLLAALRGAGAWRDPRGAALHPRHRARSMPTAPPTTRWCSPTPATSCRAATFTARRWQSQPTCSRRRWSRSRRSANGAPIAWSTRRSAACLRSSRCEGGLQVGLHAGAGDRRRCRLGDEIAGAPRRRRHDSDVGEQGGSRQHEHDRGAEGGAQRRRARAK